MAIGSGTLSTGRARPWLLLAVAGVTLLGAALRLVTLSSLPVAQTDGAPCGQTFPTPRWQPRQAVVDERVLTVPADYTASSAALGVGVYAWPSLERLPVSAGRACCRVTG